MSVWICTRKSGFEYKVEVEIDEGKLVDYIRTSGTMWFSLDEMEKNGKVIKGKRCRGAVQFTMRPVTKAS